MNRINTKIVMIFIAISLFVCFGIGANAKTGITTIPEDVTFSASSFVRVGFSQYPVESTAKPADDWVRNSASFKGPEDERLSTGTYFLYAQVFMVKNIVVSVTAASSLSYGSDSYGWSTEFVPYGWSGESKTIKSAEFNSQNPVELLRENLGEEKLAYPRSYCWSFNVLFDSIYTQPDAVVSPGQFTIHIGPVE